MQTESTDIPTKHLLKHIRFETVKIESVHLKRTVTIDLYLPKNVSHSSSINLLLINDGQDLRKFKFNEMLDKMNGDDLLQPLLCAGIHCSTERRMEYGTAKFPDCKGRGAKAGLHQRFVFHLLTFFHYA